MSAPDAKEFIRQAAQKLGFELVGFAPAVQPVGLSALQDWLDRGFAGEMHYIERRRDAYGKLELVLPGTRTVLMLGLNYKSVEPSGEYPPTSGRISRYAWGTADYHDVIRKLLKQLAGSVKQVLPAVKTRGVVDTAPVLERDFARLAGLGWFGKNTLLINKSRGSFLFLAALLLDIELEPDAPHETSHCGSCTRCLDACPTDAFVEPYILDARKCISYLTIELRGPIPGEHREGIQNWLFGCDVCQDVCPWNRKPLPTARDEFQPRGELGWADAMRLLTMTETEFQAEFGKTPLARPGRAGLARNAAIVLGNSGDPRAVPTLNAGLRDPDPGVREASQWALERVQHAELRVSELRVAE